MKAPPWFHAGTIAPAVAPGPALAGFAIPTPATAEEVNEASSAGPPTTAPGRVTTPASPAYQTSFPRDEWQTLTADPGPLIASLLPAALLLLLLVLLVRNRSRRLARVVAVVSEVLGDLRAGRTSRRIRLGGSGALGRLARELERFSSELLLARREGEEWIRELEREREHAESDARRAVLRLAATCRRVHPLLDELSREATRLWTTGVDDHQREVIGGLERRLEALRGIADDLHLLARLEAGTLEARHHPFDLRGTIEEIAGEFALRLRDRDVELIVDLDPGLPRTIVGDPLRLELLLTRLLASAARSTERGHISITLATSNDRRGVPHCSLTVTDSGAGRDPRRLATLLEPRPPADVADLDRDAEDLALAVVGALTEALDGLVQVESCPDQGTAIEVLLPCVEAHVETGARHLPNPQHRRVLVVDDLAARRRATGTLLSRLHLKVETASEAKWALAMLTTASAEEHPFDLLVVDARMGGRRGVDLVRGVRADPSLAELEVILLSSRGDEPETEALESAGTTHYLERPVRLSRWLSLLSSGEAPAESEPDAPLPAEPAPGPSPLLLLVQGPSSDRDGTEHTIAELGFRVATAAHGAEAQERLTERSVDLVLIDCRSPDLDGFGISRAIRSLPEPAGSVPLIAFTDNATFADHGACMAAGIDDCLPASTTGEDLARALGRHLRGWTPAGH